MEVLIVTFAAQRECAKKWQVHQLSKELKNVYHAHYFCVTNKYPDFSLCDLKVPSDIRNLVGPLAD